VPIPARSGSSGGKRRAVLLLSLILLVWNASATLVRLASDGIPPAAGRGGEPFPLPSPSGKAAVPPPAESPRSGPLSIRQKYLLGFRVDINKASVSEIAELPGISGGIAAAVVETRDRLGRFRSPGDLLGVRGIKAKRLQKILPFLAGMPNN